MEVDDDVEDDDMDFNPFLREDTPSEASSSLTSENEGAGTSCEKQLSSGLHQQEDIALSRSSQPPLPNSLGNGNTDGNVPSQNRLSSEGGCNEENVPENPSSQVPCENGGDASNELEKEELARQAVFPPNEQNPGHLMPEVSEEDAICRRTRARYSLANYTLEELETFLQESDDDGDLQNVDEEEEYRKFLAAVLLDGGDGTQAGQGDENLDEDENDADFELEIEEALESDGDENAENYEDMDGGKEEDDCKPQTRQKRRLNESIGTGNYCHGLTKSSLRPILPYIAPALVASSHACGWQLPSQTGFSPSSSLLSGAGADLMNGFTDQQMGQLHVSIHEHVQLLIQTFSLCILDPSQQQVAAEVKKMIVEMAGSREQALARRSIPHRVSCFQSQYIRSTFNSNSAKSSEFHWVPLIKSPVVSILDVAPLQLAMGYLNDVTAAVVKYRRSHVDGTAGRSHLRKEPLFSLPAVNTCSEANNTSMSSASPLSPGQLQHKKSLAATLVESTKKESVALVPVDISRLAHTFFPLFNFALFPHKPPQAAMANRVLFTDAEDGLLALGLLEYNNDWGAIQRRFLPCKSKHQIFVRQKNRSSSRAPDNPIKDVRRMKTSPLTIEEKEYIQEGLKVFKNDWTSVWKFFVPHRDPSLLPRQWRVATGAQKSYSKSEAAKEKRRSYEAKRRKLRASLPDSQVVPGQEVDNDTADCADGVDNDDEAYVHEAFLADSENRSSNATPCDLSLSSSAGKGMQPGNTTVQIGTNASEECCSGAVEYGEPHKGNGTTLDVAASLKPLGATNTVCNPSNASSSASYATSSKNSLSTLKLRPPASSLVQVLPSQVCKEKGSRVVKLAPDLPPVNLPPSVRVISQLAFHRNSPSYYNTTSNAAKDLFHMLPPAFTESACRPNSSRQLNLFPHHGIGISLERNEGARTNVTETSTESDFQMHPLLFQCPQEVLSSYSHPVQNLIDASRKYDLFPFDKVQVEKNNDLNIASIEKETPVDANTIDFHPLLQRTEVKPYGEAREGDCHQFINQSDCNLRVSLVDRQSTARQASAGACERENNLDLDIHLCSSVDFRNAKKDCRDILSKSNVQAEGHAKETVSLVEPEAGNACAHQCIEESNQESMQGIVMEQEELSDSEEDSEHVEFECEEMDDSDEEEFQASQPSETQNKDISTSVVLGEFQPSHDQSQVQQGSVQVGKQGASSMQKSQGSSHARSAKAKSQLETAKRTRSRTNQSVSASPPTESSRAKTRNFKAQQGQTIAERKSTASRRPRKNSAPS